MKKLLLSTVVIALAASVAACKKEPYVLTSEERDRVQMGAEEFAKARHGKFLNAMGSDSDFDDNVSAYVEVNGAEVVLNCNYKTKGCKYHK